jgi:hypothetical protein
MAGPEQLEGIGRIRRGEPGVGDIPTDEAAGLRVGMNVACREAEDTMKLMSATLCVAALCVAGLGAQSTTETTKSKTKVKVDGGRDVTVSGCLARNLDGGYKITDPRGRTLYALVGGDDLDKHVGHRIEVKGKATDGHDGKVKVETETETSRSEKTKERTELTGDVHALGVKSVKMIASSCM